MLDLDRFVEDCRAARRETTPELAVKEVLRRALADLAGVQAALGTPRQGQIRTLHHDGALTILDVVWAPGMTIYPHDHRMWALIGLYGGREDNTFYRRAGAGGLVAAGGRRIETGQTTVLGRDVIHSVTNPLRAFTGAIHVYGGDFFGTPRSEWDPDTRQERPYDVARARKAFADANERWQAACAAAASPAPGGERAG
jgi:predicted metal-dependent enzyme (double-stranded beta helix superfamily)